MATDFTKSSTRIHLSIAYLDGKHPAVVTQTGLYENERIVAFDAKLNRLWEFTSFKETSGSGGHKIEVADVDGDGRQEVFDGTTCLNPDGTLRWSIYKMHPDIVSIHRHLPDRPGLQVYYVVETSAHAGAYMVDAATGKILWKSNRDDDPLWSHGHRGWSADIWDGSPGMECVCNRAGHQDNNLLLFSADGRKIMEHFPADWTPLEWAGNPTHELICTSDFRVGKFNGKEIVPMSAGHPKRPPKGQLLMVADLYGDFRDELVVLAPNEKGEPVVSVITAETPIRKKFLAPTETLDYRLWLARNMGGGYPSVYAQPLAAPSAK
jgi:rhamnogalacturonan endolyase